MTNGKVIYVHEGIGMGIVFLLIRPRTNWKYSTPGSPDPSRAENTLRLSPSYRDANGLRLPVGYSALRPMVSARFFSTSAAD